MKRIRKTVVIVGGSAGALIAEEIFAGQYARVMFLETYAGEISADRIIGKHIKDGLAYLRRPTTEFFVATGDNRQRKINTDIIEKATGKKPINCIHPTAYIAGSSAIGNGNLICPLSVIHQGARIGNGTIINTGSIIEHTCHIHDYAQISPNTTLCGYVEVGEFAFVSAGSVVIPKISIGAGSIVAAGAAVIKNVPPNTMYAGVPATMKKRSIK